VSLLQVSEVCVNFGGIRALDHASLAVEEGHISGLIGPNGAGKTTLFNCINRLTEPQSGAIRFEGRDLLGLQRHQIAKAGITRTFQNLGLFHSMSVVDNVMLGGFGRQPARFLATLASLPSSRRAERDLRRRALDVLERLDLVRVADEPVTGLPYGTMKRVELARTVVSGSRLVLLDEPAAGLNQGEVNELKQTLRKLRAEFQLTILLVEHHMGLVMDLCDRVTVLNFGRTIAEGAPAQVRSDEAVIAAYLGPA
jgi:branched-chain amino acid transport system ATP-binding protein